MQNRTKIYSGIAVALMVAAGAGIAGAADSGGDPPTTPAGQTDVGRAAEAARAHVGSGQVTDVEVEDDGGAERYEVEVLTDDGREHEVSLDAGYQVLHSEIDEEDGD
jgi:hypothetical protein